MYHFLYNPKMRLTYHDFKPVRGINEMISTNKSRCGVFRDMFVFNYARRVTSCGFWTNYYYLKFFYLFDVVFLLFLHPL